MANEASSRLAPKYRKHLLLAPETYWAAKEFLSRQRPLSAAAIGSPEIPKEIIEDVGVYHFEGGLFQFSDWSQAMLSDLGKPVEPVLLRAWSRLPLRMRFWFEQRSSSLLTQKERVNLVFTYRELTLERWNFSEQNRYAEAHPGEVDTHAADDREPTMNEAALMRLLNFSSLTELERFLDAKENTEALQRMVSPWDDDEGIGPTETERDLLPKSRSPKPVFLLDALSIWCFASTLTVIIGFFPLPYSYFMLLRIILCFTAVLAFSRTMALEKRGWSWTFGFLAALYNPVLPIHLRDKSIWLLINILTLVLFWLGRNKLLRNAIV